jgi:response regulator NasT
MAAGGERTGGQASSGASGRPAPRVLVVEDEALVALALRDQLESVGCQIVGSVSDADSAVALARSVRPDVVLMDLGLAGSSGTKAIASIVADTGARVVVVTAYGGQWVRDAQEAGAAVILTKPVVAAQLGRAILEALGGAA